uniref:Death domain-containing protein n=1 Tax=Heterorhabditis bacteriophora TaxID=37862 RepID=A0A1I7XIM2_HETBA
MESSDRSSEKLEEHLSFYNNTLMQLLGNGRWGKIDWGRKLLGFDEITTAREGNALAQLMRAWLKA